MLLESSGERQASLYDVKLVGVSKTFGVTWAVRDLTLQVERGIFYSLLGPSGCGKTTTLRLIAGFEQPTAGQVLIRGVDVAGLPPYRRDVNTVFQSYALFPHMSVADNIAYGLRQRHVSRAEIRRRVDQALEMVRLTGAGKRRPAELSGGQQQRVALARALINRPTVLLLDEPLSALDLKLRKEMQSELKALQHTVGITFIYVMNAGQLEQEGTPTEVYERPQTRFVADFIGLTNFIDGTVHESYMDRSDGASSKVVAVSTSIGEIICGGQQPQIASGERVTLTLRPEKLQVLAVETPAPGDWNIVEGVITQATFLGAQNEYRVHVGGNSGGQNITVRQQNMGTLTGVENLDDQDIGLYRGWHVFGPGERVNLAWRHEASLILHESSAEVAQKDSMGGQVPDPHASIV